MMNLSDVGKIYNLGSKLCMIGIHAFSYTNNQIIILTTHIEKKFIKSYNEKEF